MSTRVEVLDPSPVVHDCEAWRAYACAAVSGILASGETRVDRAAELAALIADYLCEAERRAWTR